MFYSIIILHWTLNTTNYLRPKGRSFWKKRWRLSDFCVFYLNLETWSMRRCHRTEPTWGRFHHRMRTTLSRVLPPPKTGECSTAPACQKEIFNILSFGKFERILGKKNRRKTNGNTNGHLYISTPSSITETLPSMLPGVFNVTLKKEWSLEF